MKQRMVSRSKEPGGLPALPGHVVFAGHWAAFLGRAIHVQHFFFYIKEEPSSLADPPSLTHDYPIKTR